MVKLFIFVLLALACATTAKPLVAQYAPLVAAPTVVAGSAYTAYNAYTAPIAAAYTAPFAAAYTAPVAYASPYTAAYTTLI